MNEHERKRMGKYRIDKALEDASSALMYLMQQGEPLGLAHDAYIRTCEALIERVAVERASAQRAEAVGL